MAVHLAGGLLMCRIVSGELEYFLVHPGGPFFINKEKGVWSIPKGMPENGEDLLKTAQREFAEETGIISQPPYHSLESIQQKGGKVVHAWCFLGEWRAEDGIKCNTFSLEWPVRSGKFQEFPEMDKAAWMNYEQAVIHINSAQIPLLERAREILKQA